MVGRVSRWSILAVAVAAAVALDALVFPAPPSSRRIHFGPTDGGAVGVSPTLHVGAPFPDTIVVNEGAHRRSLTQSGSYVRSRPVLIATIDFYEVASYLENPPNGSVETMLESIWKDDGRKAYLLRFLFSVPGWQLRKAVHDEMARSFDDVPIDEHREELERLLQAFETGARAGDVFYLVRRPGDRVYLGVRSADDLSLVTKSPALARAIWRMWAGPTAEPGRAGLVKRLTN
jgi:hypothetical protein